MSRSPARRAAVLQARADVLGMTLEQYRAHRTAEASRRLASLFSDAEHDVEGARHRVTHGIRTQKGIAGLIGLIGESVLLAVRDSWTNQLLYGSPAGPIPGVKYVNLRR